MLVGCGIAFLGMVFGYLLGNIAMLKWHADMMSEVMRRNPEFEKEYLKLLKDFSADLRR